MKENLFNDVVSVLDEALNLGGRDLELSSELLGTLPELDSVAIVTVLVAMENRFGLVFDDDDISAEVFETVGSLVTFIEQQLA